MKKVLAAATVLAAVAFQVHPASAAGCGTITIAAMNWQSAQVLASLDKFILNNGYGCNASITVGDTVPTLTSMAEKGQPDIAPEAWVGLVPEVIHRGETEGKIVATVDSISDGGQQGWWIPKYIADAHPDIKTIPDMLKHPELFPAPEDASKGGLYNGPQGWGGTVVTAQLFKAYDGAQHGFVLVDTGSAAALDGSIAKAYAHHEPWVGYYWSPTALLGKYPMVRLDNGVPYNAAVWSSCDTVANCPDPKPSAWPTDKIETVVSTAFAKRTLPAVMDYLHKRSWTSATVNTLLAWMGDNQATGDDGARYFLEHNEAIWMPWVTPAAAAKIKAAL